MAWNWLVDAISWEATASHDLFNFWERMLLEYLSFFSTAINSASEKGCARIAFC